MRKPLALCILGVLLAVLPACGGKELGTPLVISEVQAGATGDNNHEFIELYNASDDPIDLAGHRLLYYLPTSGEGYPVYSWDEGALVPPHGHFLLTRSGLELDLVPDGEFDQALNTSFGCLVLLAPGGDEIDRLAWGDADDLAEGNPAAALENDTSLERRPGGEDGNGRDSDNNRSDFVSNATPSPQNTGSLPTPLGTGVLRLTLSGPERAEPLTQFDYTLEVSNPTDGAVHQVELAFTVPSSLTVISASSGGQIDGSQVHWTMAELADGESGSHSVTVETPGTYVLLIARDATATAEEISQPAFASPVRTSVEGGIIPIGTARTLMGAQVTVEGIATMYTGGYYAGTNNAKFYIEDETGGLQIQCFDEDGTPPVVTIGDRVRVSGEVGIYRNSMQIVPNDNTVDVMVLEQAEPTQPLETTVDQALDDQSLVGRYISLSGQATRIEEFTYSYEIDLADEMGNVLLVYVDKLTELDLAVESMDVNHLYTLAGVAEMYDDILQLKPRTEDDLVEIFAPELMVEGHTLPNATTGAILPYELTLYNHTDGLFSNLVVTATLPSENAVLATVEDGGSVEGSLISWTIATLPARESLSVRFAVTVTGESGVVSLSSYGAHAEEWPTPASDLPLLTFIGDTVPIYAVQGPASSSPYKLEYVDTEGVITGIFEDLEGFWIQSLEADGDGNTSEGLFIYVGELGTAVETGDLVRVHGRVRERGSQTELHPTAQEDVTVLETGLAAPAAVELDPPIQAEEAVAYYETLEGMLVTVSGPAIAVSPINQYGEYTLVLPEHGVERVMRGDPTGLLIHVDDGSHMVHEDGSTLPYSVRAGDRVESLTGPLAFTFGSHKIEPLSPPDLFSTSQAALPQLPELAADQFSIATFNMNNFFDPREPHPVSDPPRPSRDEYGWRQDRFAQVILAMGAPTILGVQEVENIEVLEELAAHPALVEYDYQAVLIEGGSSLGIDVGFLVRGDRASVEGIGQYQAPGDLFSRPPLMITATLQTEVAGDITLYAIVNHLISKSGGEELTEPRRILETEWNSYLVDEILSDEPDAFVAVLGDLNDYYDSAPLSVLTEGSTPGGQLVNCMSAVERDERYSFIFQGVSQLLDHILVTPELARYLRIAQALHINADYPLPDMGSSDPHRSADHDPVVAIFEVE
jgi:predicted extracellular nuclease